ncbi:peptidase, M23B family protein [Nostoc sp. NIES-4103]|nr:peptidase, M23B family protein [Nostoc sp. NIES-4103]
MTYLVTHPLRRCVSFILALFLTYFCLGKTAIAAPQTHTTFANNDNYYHSLAQDISTRKALTANTNKTYSEFATELKDVIEKDKSIAPFPTLLADSTGTTSYVWPISNSATPDEMNTSFGPRMNNDKWDFHDGIDLPDDCGTDVHAVANGTVVDAGNADSNNSSRHVVLKVNDSTDGDIYVYYLHLESIAVSSGSVSQGDVLGKVGKDNANYCHLHLELRRGNRQQISSYHPLRYLPYTNTPNFTAPTSARFNRQSNGLMAARLLFDASSRLEGDLERVEVDLKNGTTLLGTPRVVNFNDKTTIQEGNGDEFAFTNDIAVEGYQSSNMGPNGDNRNDLKYSIIVRNLPSDCNTLVARVYDVRGTHVVTSAAITVPNQTTIEESLNFEDGLTIPTGWTQIISTSGAGTSIANDATIAHGGTRSLRSTDNSNTESSSQQAGIEYDLPNNRFEWQVESWIRPSTLELSDDSNQVYLLDFLTEQGINPSVAARIRYYAPKSLFAEIVARRPDNIPGKENLAINSSKEAIITGTWRNWRLRLSRIGTRETKAVLYLDNEKKAELFWDSTAYEPSKVQVGIGRSFSKAKATVNTDDVLLTEKTL